MPICIRPAEMADLLGLQGANLKCLAENYDLGFWIYHMMLSPGATHVALSAGRGVVLGYVLAKHDDEDRKKSGTAVHGGLTSVAVMSRVRKLGLGRRLMGLTHIALRDAFLCEYALLHVRETNRAAQRLYVGYKYQVQRVDERYFADGENAFAMKLVFPKRGPKVVITRDGGQWPS